MKQSKKVVARIIILILALFTVIPGTVSQKVYAEPGGSESSQAADASKDDSNKKEEKKEEDMTPEEREKKAEEDAYKMEIQSNGWKNWPKGPGTYGEAAIVMDAGTGSILYAKNIDEHEYPASITKVLTSLIALKYGNLSDKVTFSNDCISFMQPGDSSVGLKEGNVISLEQALYATLLASANEAAYAVAENVGKNAGHDYNWFIQQMNEECKSLGGNNSNFVNANGLHDEQHYTTAHDMARIGAAVYQKEAFRTISQSLSHTIPATNLVNEERTFQQKHKMLWPQNDNYYEYCKGGKTGYTDQARTTLVTMADNGDMQLVAVVLYDFGNDAYIDTRAMFDYAYSNFSKISLKDQKLPEGVKSYEDEDAYIVLPKSAQFSDVKAEVKEDSNKDGSGTVTFTYKGQEVGSVKAAIEKTEESSAAVLGKKKDKTTSTVVTGISKFMKIVIGVVIAVVILLIIIVVLANYRKQIRRRRRKKGKRRNAKSGNVKRKKKRRR